MRPDPNQSQATPSTAEIGSQLDLILRSQPFVDSPRLAEFLRYVVDETLAGRAGWIKGFTIAQEVFGRDDPEDAQTSTVVRVEAGRLRRCLSDYYSGDRSEDKVHIEIPKGAYVPNFRYLALDHSQAGDVGKENSGDVQAKAPSPHARYFSKITAAAVVGALIALTAWFLLTIERDQTTSMSSALTQSGGVSARPSIAVMPFESSLQDQQAGNELAKGLTEDIITDLSRLAGADVVALPSVQALGPSAELETISERLKVSHVLRGSIRGTAERARVTAQLYDTRTGAQIWADRFDRRLDEVLAVEDELALKIADGLSIELDPASLNTPTRRRADNPEVYALFNQAMQLVNPPTDPGRLQVSRAAFERIIDMDPDFAGGYAGVAYTSSFLAFWGHTKFPESEIEKSMEFANKAIDRDKSFGIAYSAMAFANISRGEFDEAVAISSVGVTKQPNDPYVSAYHGYLLAANGQAEDGVAYLKRALFLDPLNPRTPFLNILGHVYFLAEEPEKSLQSLMRSLERGGPVSPGNTLVRVAALVSLDRVGEARELADSIKNISTGFNLQAWVEWVNRTFRYQQDKDKWFDPLRELGLL